MLATTILNALALGLFARSLSSWFFKPEGWAERYLEMPASASRQFRGAGRVLTLAAMILLVPAHLFIYGEISHDGHALTAPALARFLILGFEVLVLASLIYHLRPSSALMLWINPDVSPGAAESTRPTASAARLAGDLDHEDAVGRDRFRVGDVGLPASQDDRPADHRVQRDRHPLRLQRLYLRGHAADRSAAWRAWPSS